MTPRTVAGRAVSAPAHTPREQAEIPKLIAGAEACHRMMTTLQGLKILRGEPEARLANASGPDDGNRLDYQAADKAIAEALDAEGSNPGFRQALSNYLLAVHAYGPPIMANWPAAAMLTDDDYRPPASEVAASEDAERAFRLFDFEDTGSRIEWTLSLISWIEGARRLIGSIATAAEIDSRFAAALQSADIRFHHDFDDEASEGLQCVLTDVLLMNRQMKAAGETMEAAQRGKAVQHG